MFHRILVPVDDTARSVDSIDVARHLATRMQTSVVLLHVQALLTGVPEAVSENQELEQQVRTLREAGIDARHFMASGNTEEAIAEAATEQHADLIIMAPHHRARLEALRHPSVTARVLASAPAPVLVWPEKAPGNAYSSLLNSAGAVVVVPLDGSDTAERALPVALTFAREFRSPLLLLRVVPPVTPVASGAESYGLVVDYELSQEREARHYLATIRRRLVADPTLTITSMVLRGQPEHELVRVAETHTGSLIVMSTHGRGSLARMLMGSVATRLMRDSPLPLVVVSPHADYQVAPSAIAASTAEDEAAAR